MNEQDKKIIAALEALSNAADTIMHLWDHTGTNMIDGYPNYLPSYDEFTADLNNWLDTQRRIRT